MTELLQPFADGIWEYNIPLTVAGIRMGHRMTVAKVSDGSLWIHSPVPWSPRLDEDLRALGTPAFFVAPSMMHDAWWTDWFFRHPHAHYAAAAGLREQHPDLPFTHVLADDTYALLEADLHAHVLRGVPLLNESVFLHRPSRTLIVADLLFNLAPPDPLSRLMLWVNGAYGKLTPSRYFKRFIADRALFRQSIDWLLGWDFDRLIVGHGANLASGAKDAVRRAFTFLD